MRANVLILVAGGFLSGLSGSDPIDAHTWRVTADGSGDAPSIEAAMDSTAVGDTVLVGPGEHVIAQVSVANGIVLLGEEGPHETRIIPYPEPTVLSGLSCGLLPATTIIADLWFDGFRSGAGYGAINVEGCVDPRISGCVFTNNEFGIVMFSEFGIRVEGNTFVNNTLALNFQRGTGVCMNNIIWNRVQGLQSFAVICNDVFLLEDVPTMYRFANFSQDPQFCGTSDFHLAESSPCAPGNTPLDDDCGLIGALPVNCSPTAVQERTWGQVKALYMR